MNNKQNELLNPAIEARIDAGGFAQVLITDTDATRLDKVLDGLGLDVRFFAMDQHRGSREKAERSVAG